jgi:carboxymethylenebutenolidase
MHPSVTVLGSILVLGPVVVAGAGAQELPADADAAVARLEQSARHGEWVRYDAGGGDTVSAWVVHPERAERAPVVIVIHEIFGLTDWIRAVADQVASAGFIAIAPDLLSGKGPGGGGTTSFDGDAVRQAIRDLASEEVIRRLDGAARYAAALPAARAAYAVIGFCWGGSTRFEYATRQPGLRGAVVYYGSSPEAGYERISAAVLGLYGGDDARVNATIPRARDAMDAHRKRYEVEVYDGAGHGFLRAQSGREGANLVATRAAWARTVAFLREVLGDTAG